MKNDKTKHVIVGSCFGLLTLPISYFTGLWWALLITLVFGTIVFVAKEINDKYKPNPTGFDKADLQADFYGWISGAILSFFIHGIIQIFAI
jgi:hypothetical protein